MKANSRRRVLISSLAMLLVALVALSTATYAWFSNKTTATATGLQASTTQASNLLLSKTGTSDDWHSSIDYTMGSTVLEPVTTKDFSNWSYAIANGFDAAVANADGLKAVEEGKQGTYYVVKDLYIKSSTEDMDVNWSMTLTYPENNPTDLDFFRVALQPVGEAPGAFVWGNAKDDFANAPATYTTKGSTSYNSVVTTMDTAGELGTLEAGTAYHYRVYLYFEGTDKDCIDTNAVNTCNVQFDFSKKPAAQG